MNESSGEEERRMRRRLSVGGAEEGVDWAVQRRGKGEASSTLLPSSVPTVTVIAVAFPQNPHTLLTPHSTLRLSFLHPSPLPLL